MNCKSVLLLLSCLFVFFNVISQTSISENQYSGMENAYFTMLDNDGHMLSLGIEGKTFKVLKTNTDDGIVLNTLSYTFNDADSVYVTKATVAINGDYCFLVNKNKSTGNESIVLRTDDQGNVIFSKRFYLSGTTTFNVIKEDAFGNLIIGGGIYDGFNGVEGPMMLKIDALGSLIWFNTYDNLPPSINDFEILDDGSYVAIGFHNQGGNYILGIDANGVVSDFSYVDLSGVIKMRSIRKIPNGFMLGGEIAGGGSNGSFDYFVGEIDNSFNLIWSKAIGGLFRDELKFLEPYNSDSYLLYGVSASENNLNFRPELMRVSLTGEMIWSRVYGGDDVDDLAGGFVVTSENEILTNINDLSSDENGLRIVRTNKFGDANCGIQSGSLDGIDLALSSVAGNALAITGIPVIGELIELPTVSTFGVTTNEVCPAAIPNPTMFQKILVAPDLDLIQSVVETFDGGYVAVGIAGNGIHGDEDILCLRVDKNGDTLWTKFYGTADAEAGADIIKDSDGGFVILNKRKVELIKIDANGEVLFSKSYSNDQPNVFSYIEKSSMIRSKFDNSIVIYTNGGLYKVNEDFTLDWYTGSLSSYNFTDIKEYPNGDFIIITEIGGGNEMYRVDANGNLVWERRYQFSTSSGGSFGSIDILDNGDLIAAGSGFDPGIIYPVLTRFNSVGDVVWTKKYPNSTRGAFNDVLTKNNEIYAVGYLWVEASEPEDPSSILMKLDANGNSLWLKGYGAYYDNSQLTCIEQTNDNGFILGGYSSAYGNGGSDFYLIKTDSLGNSGSCHEYDRVLVSGIDLPFADFNVPNFGTNTVTVEANTSVEGANWTVLYRDLDLQIEVDKTNVTCGGLSNGSISISVSEGIANYSYSWDTGEETSELTSLPAGDYTLTVTDNVGCEAIEVVTIEEPDAMTSTVDFTNPLCTGTNTGIAEVNVMGGVEPYTYQWNSGQLTAQSINLLAGNYAVNVLDANNCLHSNLVTLTDPDPIEVSFQSNAATCGASDGSITAIADGGDNNFSYSWDNLVNGPLNDNIESGLYEVTAEDGNGCLLTEEYDLGSQVTPVDICLITVDTNSLKNVIVWEKEIAGNIAGYNVYRNVLGAYQNIGYVPYTDLSEFTDNSFGVDPNVTSYRYQISKVDTCGNESELSEFHETMHLTTNQGTNDEVNLIWDEYEGFPFVAYRIMKDTTNNGIYDYYETDAVGSGVFTWTDNDPENYTSYTVVVDPSVSCSSTKANDYNSSRSNRAGGISINNGVGIDELTDDDFAIYPNPNTGTFILKSYDSSINEFDVLDAYGKVVFNSSVSSNMVEVKLNVEAGIYFVRIKNESYSLIKRITIR